MDLDVRLRDRAGKLGDPPGLRTGLVVLQDPPGDEVDRRVGAGVVTRTVVVDGEGRGPPVGGGGRRRRTAAVSRGAARCPGPVSGQGQYSASPVSSRAWLIPL